VSADAPSGGGGGGGTPAGADPHTIVELIVDGDERTGGGFLEIRRLRLRNRRADGTISAPYVCDSIARPYGQDAVVVVVYAVDRTGGAAAGGAAAGGGVADRGGAGAGGVQVLLREGLRPALTFGRSPALAPLPEPPPQPFFTELVAGVIEPGDRGEAGLCTRAAHEIAEEAGFEVEPSAVTVLGAGAYPSPGSMVEKFYFVAAEVDPATQRPLPGDGSPMEEGARTRWLSLDEALAACDRGDVPDLKTEVGLRRLRDHLARARR
jgi:ADP-ribose pyrophosphatase